MPKRIGHVWEELTDIEHCNRSVLAAIENKKKTHLIRRVKENYKEYGERLQKTIITGWEPDETRRKSINEGTNQKQRDLLIPSLKDHMVHTAVAKILEKKLAKRFYFYVAGSLPGKGQTFITKALEGRIRKKKPKYCAVADIKACYKSIKKETVMMCLTRVFKDEKFLQLNEKILDQMQDGLAIGFTVSHWYAHLVLSCLDETANGDHVRAYRYMDNFVLLCKRKRTLHKRLKMLADKARTLGLRLKEDWQVFQLRKRMVEFLSYRFGYDRTVLRKKLMYRMSHFLRGAHLNAHTARVVMSYRGILKHCDSYAFRLRFLYPNVSIKQCRRLISDADKKSLLHTGAADGSSAS